MLQAIESFFDKFYDPSKPILLGFSGGPDSLALFYLLLAYQKTRKFELHLAHLDHGWREESGREAEQLKKLAASLGTPFHLKKIEPGSLKGNLEAASRQERLNFFSELTTLYGFQSVLLAHHADDQSETVLKAVLEGKSLPYLSGMAPVNTIQGLTIWRPLIGVSKKEIVQFIDKRCLEAINDSTNLDPRFLRGRFRTAIIPNLSKDFGKEVSPSLCRLGEEAAELRNYLNEQIQPYLETIQESIFGLHLDLSLQYPKSKIEVKYLIRRLAERKNLALTNTVIETIVNLLDQNSANKQVGIAGCQFYIDRRRLFLLEDRGAKSVGEKVALHEGKTIQWGNWNIEVSPSNAFVGSDFPNWKNVWKGEFSVSIPKGNYFVSPHSNDQDYQIGQRLKNINNWWTDHKVPAFLRSTVPVILEDDKIIAEFLTGKNPGNNLAGPHLHLFFHSNESRSISRKVLSESYASG